MAELHVLGLDIALREAAQRGTPIMGICLGMQLLFDSSEEFGHSAEATRSQDLPQAHVLNGALYLIRPNQLRAMRTFCPPDAQPLIIDAPWESLDIDTPWDWFLAEKIAENLSELNDL